MPFMIFNSKQINNVLEDSKESLYLAGHPIYAKVLVTAVMKLVWLLPEWPFFLLHCLVGID